MLRTYDLFELLPKGVLIWRAKFEGQEEAISQLQELAKQSANELRLIHIPTKTTVATANAKAV